MTNELLFELCCSEGTVVSGLGAEHRNMGAAVLNKKDKWVLGIAD